jgi:hypothetical protein
MLTGAQVAKEFRIYYGTRRYIDLCHKNRQLDPILNQMNQLDTLIH